MKKEIISVIESTNRMGSQTEKVTDLLISRLEERGPYAVKKLSMKRITGLEMGDFNYDKSTLSNEAAAIQDEFLMDADRFIFVMPEYNGSFPGILKFFIDAVSVRDTKRSFGNKKALLIGVAQGRAGNLRGLDQFADILNHLGCWVHPAKQPISAVQTILAQPDGEEVIVKILDPLLDRFFDNE